MAAKIRRLQILDKFNTSCLLFSPVEGILFCKKKKEKKKDFCEGLIKLKETDISGRAILRGRHPSRSQKESCKADVMSHEAFTHQMQFLKEWFFKLLTGQEYFHTECEHRAALKASEAVYLSDHG